MGSKPGNPHGQVVTGGDTGENSNAGRVVHTEVSIDKDGRRQTGG